MGPESKVDPGRETRNSATVVLMRQPRNGGRTALYHYGGGRRDTYREVVHITNLVGNELGKPLKRRLRGTRTRAFHQIFSETRIHVDKLIREGKETFVPQEVL